MLNNETEKKVPVKVKDRHQDETDCKILENPCTKNLEYFNFEYFKCFQTYLIPILILLALEQLRYHARRSKEFWPQLLVRL